MLLRHEKEKKREYDRRIMNIQDGAFTPLIFSVSGVLGKKCSMFHKDMAEKIAITLTKVMKKLSLLLGENYHLSFWDLLYIRGSRSNYVLKDIDEFSLAFDRAWLWGVAWATFP